MIGTLRRLVRTRMPAPFAPGRLAARYLDHNVPARAAAGATTVLRLRAENTGDVAWLRDPPDGHYTGVAAFLDGGLVSVGRMLADRVEPGGRSSFAVSFTWPEAGACRLALDLFVNDRAFFKDQGTPALEAPVALHRPEATPTDALLAVARRHDEWFYSPGQGIHRTREGAPAYPMFAEGASGAEITDVDGRSFVDLHMGWGCNLLGYADERVQEAVARSLRDGGITSLLQRAELDVAEALCDRFGFGDEVLFGKNGSDVTTWAVRVARAATGRRTVVYAGYHGWQDWNAAGHGFAATGIPSPPGPAVGLRYGDREALEAAAAAHAADLAAIVIEPAASQWDDDPHHERDRAYLAAGAELARRHGAVLVFDEIFTGFRFRGGSAQAHYGVRPDLTCLAKALSNGMALSALVGRGGLLRKQIGRIVYAPTNKGEAHSFAAARAALAIYGDEDVAAEVWAVGEALRAGVETLCRERALPARLVGPPYRMLFRLAAGDREQRLLAHTALQQELARNGVVSHRGYAILSRRHDDAVVARCLGAYAAALDRVAAAVRDRAFGFLDIPDVPEEARP